LLGSEGGGQFKKLAPAADPAVIAQALAPNLEDRQILEAAKETNPARRPLRPRTAWQNEQRRSSRNELPPLHSITSSVPSGSRRHLKAGYHNPKPGIMRRTVKDRSRLFSNDRRLSAENSPEHRIA
jgi:hypothetical protein